jgi:hypothetical protein
VSSPTNRRRALELLAANRKRLHRSDHACARFKPEMVVEMIRDGLATASAERMIAGGKSIEIARMKITDAGRRTLVNQRNI